jgi:hypothetical protein
MTITQAASLVKRFLEYVLRECIRTPPCSEFRVYDAFEAFGDDHPVEAGQLSCHVLVTRLVGMSPA